MNSTNQNNRGVTMIEIILYLAISAIIFFACFSVLELINQSKVKSQITLEVEYQGQILMTKILQSIRDSKKANMPLPQASGSNLSLNTYNSSVDPTIFTFSSGNLTVKEGVGSEIPLNSSKVSISDISFSNNSTSSSYDSIRFTYTISYNNQTGRTIYDYSKTFYGTASTRLKK